MEGYCKTTGCLRNYILEYFGEKTFGPCDNCGNCHREYHETDMTREAKWVVNCVAETRGKYGLTIVLGTLLGAKRARLRELGADKYKSYGALNDHSEAELRALISQMTEMGYLYQTQERYSVLKLGDISPLRDENTHVIMRTYEEKEPDKKKKPQKSVRKRSTDALTAAGYDLFEALRKLRLQIAKEEAMPPYIVFSDKTLIDMCIKCPSNEEEMLEVSGVGENKLKKYGQRFLEEIQKFCLERPNAVLSMSEDEMVIPENKGWKTDEYRKYTEELITLRHYFHQYPELALQEVETSAYIRKYLEKLGYEIVPIEPTGLIAELPSLRNREKLVVLRAEMDALPIQEQTNLPYASVNQGCMHACGHDMILAAALILAKIVAEEQRMQENFPVRLRFLFEPAEEIGEGAKECFRPEH